MNSIQETVPVRVTLSTDAEGATIRYTLDGTAADELSTIYREPIRITSSERQISVLAHRERE